MTYLGIDVGSSYVKFWQEDPSGHAVASLNIHHRGSVRDVVLETIESLRPAPSSICICGHVGDSGLDGWRSEGLLAEIDFLRARYPHRRLLVLGAEKIEYVEFDGNGGILVYQTNSACAAGTGSFLDEQMIRLGLCFDDLGTIPIEEDAPTVATRCAVFAKTDLVHLQQEGHSAFSMYNGLCKGLVLSSLKSVFGGKLPDGSAMLAAGGLLANPHVRHFLARSLPRITLAGEPAFTRARGLCMKARTDGYGTQTFRSVLAQDRSMHDQGEALKELNLEKSTFPSHDMVRSRDDHDNEFWHDLPRGTRLDCLLGVDIGSTSTKAVLVDEKGRIRLDIYTRTGGNPIEATRRIFAGIRSIEAKLGSTVNIRSCGTTGSGRKLVGVLVGADLVVNEISAHARGALTLDPGVRTIFEIGGQDAKFIRLEDGRIVDVNMNYVCAAGTGSFVEEQARTLGIDLDDIGDMVMGVRPLPNSDRCTVFMNQEVTRQVAASLPRERIMAGVLLAVFRNYLSKVVGNRAYGRDRIVFQGATARNRGLVAALEQITGAEILVSPFCHVMGAYGAALLSREKCTGTSVFRGFELKEISVRESTCNGCENGCRITHVKVGEVKTSWGYMCGREPGEAALKKRTNPCIQAREQALAIYDASPDASLRSVKMPALSLNEEFLPLFQEIATACGARIELCLPERLKIIKELSSSGSGDFCYPIKVAMASAKVVLKEDPACLVLLPHLIQDEKDPAVHPRSLYCPFITALPGFFRNTGHSRRILSPVIDLNRSASGIASAIQDSLRGSGLPCPSRSRLTRAVTKGIERLRNYRADVHARCRRVLDDLPEGRSAVVLLGRPYNLYHKILNLGIPELIESLGYPVVTMDAVPDGAGPADVTARFPDLYWNQGMRILRTALSLKGRPDLFPLVISNFSCGPDSFILTYLEEVFRGKPYLILELDEHGSATGYQTRIEAFLDMIGQHRQDTPTAQVPPKPLRIRYGIRDIHKDARVWIPQIHPYTPQLWAAVLNRYGLDARAMGEETEQECVCGRSMCRGSECLPTAVTTGKLLSLLAEASGDTPQVLFMPRAEGPCRFGQYATLQSMILDRTGHTNTLILSPTSENGYGFFSPSMELDVFRALCLGDALFKLRCRVMPYHDRPELAEALMTSGIEEISSCIRSGKNWKDTLRSLIAAVSAHRRPGGEPKPLVGIVGEIFVRLNSFSNQHIVRTIEAAGGEAWLAPMSEWLFYVWDIVAGKSSLLSGLKTTMKSRFLHMVEERVMDLFSPILDHRHEPPVGRVIAEGQHFVPRSFEGGSILTLGRAKLFAEQGARLVVNCSPFGCMPGRITSYIFQAFRDHFGVPVVNLFFDGTGDIAGQVAMYLKSISRGPGEGHAASHALFRKPPAASPGSVVHPGAGVSVESHREKGFPGA